MVTVHAIHELNIGEIYVGMTNDLDRRMREHRRGQSRYTRNFKDFEFIHTETVQDYVEARKGEKYLKSGCGKELLREKVKNQAGIV